MMQMEHYTNDHVYTKVSQQNQENGSVEFNTNGDVTLSANGTEITSSEGLVQSNFDYIDCCVNTNDNTACSYGEQSEEC